MSTIAPGQIRGAVKPLFVFSLMAFALAASCASAPGKFYADRPDGFACMAPGALVYFQAEVAGARPVLDRLMLGGLGGAGIADFLDMTTSVTAAIYARGAADGGRRFLAAANGKYPSLRGGIFFGASGDWARVASALGPEYWRSDAAGLSLFLGPSRAYISDGDPFVPPPGAERPPSLAPLAKGAALSGWMDDPGPALGAITAALNLRLNIPAERLLFAVYAGDKARRGASGEALFNAALRLEFRDELQAKAVSGLFSLARAAQAFMDFSSMGDLGSLAALLLSSAPLPDGNALVIRAGPVNGAGLALLFNTLQVYSKQ